MNTYAERVEKTLPEKNNTNIPHKMKTKFERSSGFSFNDVKVHYNSEKPAQLHAHAYTQGNNVYVAPGQEKHLPHELGHVVQQKSHMVKPNGEIGGLPLNDDQAMESDADKIAEEAEKSSDVEDEPVQGKFKDGGIVQREETEKPSEEMSYYNWAGKGATIIGALGLAGGIAGFLYQKHTDRKHRYIEEIEKYADAACDALEEQIAAATLYNRLRGGNEELEKAKAEAEILKQKKKVRRNYMAAVMKTGAKKKGIIFKKDKIGDTDSNGILRDDGLTDYFNEENAAGVPPNQALQGDQLLPQGDQPAAPQAPQDVVKNNIVKIKDKNVRDAIVRARTAYKESLLPANNAQEQGAENNDDRAPNNDRQEQEDNNAGGHEPVIAMGAENNAEHEREAIPPEQNDGGHEGQELIDEPQEPIEELEATDVDV